MSLLRCAALTMLAGCAATAPAPFVAAHPPQAAPTAIDTTKPTKPTKPTTPTAATPPTLPLERVTWTAGRAPSVVSHSPETSWIDVHPRLPASSTHPLGTALLVTLEQPAPGAMPQVMLYEWDPRASRALRALRLPGGTLEVRSVMAFGELVLVRLSEDAHVELLRVDAALENARVTPVDLGKNPSRLALVGGAHQLVVSANVLAGDRVVRRLLALDREGASRAHRDVQDGPTAVDVLRIDSMVLRDATVYVVGHDPAEPPGKATAEHPALPGALGVLSFDAGTLEPRALRMTDVEPSSPANLYPSAKGVLLVSEGRVLELDAALRAVKRTPRLHGPHLALGSDGVVYDVPQRLRLAPESSQQRTCFPARLANVPLYACATRDEGGQGTLDMLR